MTSEFYIEEQVGLQEEDLPRAVQVDVVFGMPAKKCLYHGICKLDLKGNLWGKTYPKGRSASAIVTLSPTGQLLFKFLKKSMDAMTMEKHFGSGYFIVLQDIGMPVQVGRALGRNGYTIQQGIYEVVEGDRYLGVLL